MEQSSPMKTTPVCSPVTPEPQEVQYTWSFDKEADVWSNDIHDTPEQCIREARVEALLDAGNPRSVCYVGEVIPFQPVVDACAVLEQLEQLAADECGEVGEDWESFDPKDTASVDALSDALTNTVKSWLEQTGRTPHFYKVESIRECDLGLGSSPG